MSISPKGLRWPLEQHAHLACHLVFEPSTRRHPSIHHGDWCNNGNVGTLLGTNRLSFLLQRGSPQVRVEKQSFLHPHTRENRTPLLRPYTKTNTDTSLMVVHNHRNKHRLSPSNECHSLSGSATGSITTRGMFASIAWPSSH